MCGFGQPSSGTFGSSNTTASSVFGMPATNTSTGIPANMGGGFFGGSHRQQAGSLFGSSAASNGFGANQNVNRAFGASFEASPFSSNTNSASGSLFGQPHQTQSSPAPHLFASNNNNSQQLPQVSGLFGQANRNDGLFGRAGNTRTGNGGGLFGSNHNNFSQSVGLFGNSPKHTQNTGLFGDSRPQPLSSVFGSTDNNTTGFRCFCVSNRGLQPLNIHDTNAVSLTYEEKETNGTTSVYHNVFSATPYQQYSPEEVRLFDYDNGRTRPAATTTKLSVSADNVRVPDSTSLTGLFSQVQKKPLLAGCENCAAIIASKDAEIRLLKAKAVILEDQLQRANYKPEFGKPSFDRTSTFAKSTIQTSTLSSDGTNKSNNNKPLPSRVDERLLPGVFTSLPNCDIENISNFKEADTNSTASTSKPLNIDSSKIASTAAPTDATSQTNKPAIQSDFQNERINHIESQLLKVTAILERMALPVSSVATTDRERSKAEEDGKGRADEEAQVSGTSTPAILIYTPDSSACSTSPAIESDIEKLTNDLVEPNVANNNQKETTTENNSYIANLNKLASLNLTANELRVLIVLKTKNDRLSIHQITESTGMNITDVHMVLTRLMAQNFVVLVEGHFYEALD